MEFHLVWPHRGRRSRRPSSAPVADLVAGSVLPGSLISTLQEREVAE